MEQLAAAGFGGRPKGPGWNGLAQIGAGLATFAAVAIGAVLALLVAAAVVVLGLMSAALIGLGGLAYRARRAGRPRDETLIEARHVGGHSWVAYGWDRRGR
jgi:amino acid transporter